MTTNQTAIVIRECIREAAKACGCQPSAAHQPGCQDKQAIAARNMAIRMAYRQGVSKPDLASAFRRTWETINDVLRLRRAAPGECPRCGCTDAAECASRCGTAQAERETADLDAASLV